MTNRQALTLFICHALTTWSAHTYEFAAPLFAAAAFPHGLRIGPLITIANHVATIFLAPVIGRRIDHGKSRLRSLLTTIFINKAAIITACILWQFIIQEKARPADDREAEIQGDLSASTLSGTPKMVTFGLILLSGLVETLARKANLISMERDWVPTLASPSSSEGWTLLQVNAMMWRIDLVCKVLAPPVVTQFLAVVSPKLAALLFMMGYLFSFWLEITTSERLYKMSDELQRAKSGKSGNRGSYGWQQQRFEPRKSRAIVIMYGLINDYVMAIRVYFCTEVWAASLAMCLTYASALSLAGVMTVFLLDSGYSRQLVTIATSIGASFELCGTFVWPIVTQKLSHKMTFGTVERVNLRTDSGTEDSTNEDPERAEDDGDASSSHVNTAAAHTGMYGALWLLMILLPAALLICYLVSTLSYPMARYSDNRSPTFNHFPLVTVILLGTLALSNFGQVILDLSTLQLGQARVGSVERSSFAGVEMGIISIISLGQHIATAVYSDPRGFDIIAITSWICLLTSILLYLWWMRRDGVAWSWSKALSKGYWQQIVT